MFVFLKIILSFSFRSFFDTLIFYRFVFKVAIPEEIHANQELFTESLAIFREERYGGRIYSKFLRRTVNSHRCRIFQDPTASDLKNTKEKKASHRRQNIKNLITVV